MSAAEIAAAKREIRRLVLPLDLRRTAPAAGRSAGSRDRPPANHPPEPAAGWRDPGHRPQPPDGRPPPLVVLCDISGSMSRYSQILLHFLHAVTNDRDRVHVFLFGTRLPTGARQLRHRDPQVAFQMVSHVVPDWSGGTPDRRCAGYVQPALGAARAGAGGNRPTDHRRARSRRCPRTGRKHGPAAHRSCRRLIWLNPLLRWAGFEPKSQGIRAMLPHVDDFRPRAQPGQPARAGRSSVPPRPARSVLASVGEPVRMAS